MKYPLLQVKETPSIHEFIDFWSKQYYYPKNELYYIDNIGKPQYNKEDILQLYTWKNGMSLSGKKLESLESKIQSKIDIINTYKKKKLLLEGFLYEFKEVSFVWKIFLLHIIEPNTYPIYDQHVHRAYTFLAQNEPVIQNANQKDFYFTHYLTFIKRNKIEDLKKNG